MYQIGTRARLVVKRESPRSVIDGSIWLASGGVRPWLTASDRRRLTSDQDAEKGEGRRVRGNGRTGEEAGRSGERKTG
ncbi:hypothetical protein Cni_G11206 [Canna indica]|uniref:Uncharacterized protein n=1 Tax=Canna indica TaxID=4628 RepID=A0AAQ3K5X0_9LILI|nr:hypothetical protein Cni_G11206 [Canna indica]